jgi:hypothetical protein
VEGPKQHDEDLQRKKCQTEYENSAHERQQGGERRKVDLCCAPNE